jgi:hypothetical protein
MHFAIPEDAAYVLQPSRLSPETGDFRLDMALACRRSAAWC